jgi:GNAT superfamily N-acetyltransferase
LRLGWFRRQVAMRLQLRPALEADLAFCESLSRSNMTSYHLARGIAWDQNRFLTSWAQFDNFVISADDLLVGLLRLLVVGEALEIRDLHVVPTHWRLGIGTWAVAQAKSKAANRGLEELRLRVYTDNPARHLYARLGFKADSTDGDILHMSCALPPGSSFKPKPLRD